MENIDIKCTECKTFKLMEPVYFNTIKAYAILKDKRYMRFHASAAV